MEVERSYIDFVLNLVICVILKLFNVFEFEFFFINDVSDICLWGVIKNKWMISIVILVYNRYLKMLIILIVIKSIFSGVVNRVWIGS